MQFVISYTIFLLRLFRKSREVVKTIPMMQKATKNRADWPPQPRRTACFAGTIGYATKLMDAALQHHIVYHMLYPPSAANPARAEDRHAAE
ncbi:MAG: hypothetical protein QM656_10870 [Paracoccaceae bacterium]